MLQPFELQGALTVKSQIWSKVMCRFVEIGLYLSGLDISAWAQGGLSPVEEMQPSKMTEQFGLVAHLYPLRKEHQDPPS
jgi:hypothetical protein